MNELQNVNQLTSEILFYKNQAAQNFLEIGRRLNQVKAMIPHGEWGEYLNSKVNFSQNTANKLMRCANEFTNCSATNNLSMAKMFELLALPAENREDFMQKNNVEELAQKKLREQIKKYKKELNEAKEVNDSLRADCKEFKRVADDIQKKLEKERGTCQTYAEDRIALKRQNEELAQKNNDLQDEVHSANYMYKDQKAYADKITKEVKELKQKLEQHPEGKETIVIQDDPKTLARIKELEQEKVFIMYDAKLNHLRQELLNGLKTFFDTLDFLIDNNKTMAKNHLTMIDNSLQNYQDHLTKAKEKLND